MITDTISASLHDLIRNGRNGSNTLREWARDTLSESMDDPQAIEKLTIEADNVIAWGGLRG